MLVVTAARAETLTLGGRTVILEPPAGYCALDPALQSEADLIAFNEKMQQPRNHLVMQLADCGELADFRRLRMREVVAAQRKSPHPEPRAQRASRRTHRPPRIFVPRAL